MSEAQQHTYPHGVPCWIDRATTDLDGIAAFYGELLGWQFHTVTPPDAAFEYRVATVDGQDVGAVGAADHEGGWSTYVSVDDVDESAAAVSAAGGHVVFGPEDVGPAGRVAACTDPAGASIVLWQAGERPGAQLVNAPGGWNFSHLRTNDLASVQPFYEQVFGWRFVELAGIGGGGWNQVVQVAGYGQHLHDTVDPDIYERQANAPEGFADVVAGVERAGPDEATADWKVVISVADRDAAADKAEQLGGTVHDRADTDWTRTVRISDPQGAMVTLSQYAPPDA